MMKTPPRLLSLALVVWVTLPGCAASAAADDPPPRDAADTAPTEAETETEAQTQSEDEQPPRRVAPEVDQRLDRIEAAADDLETLTADLRYDRVQGLLGDEQRRFGQFRYRAGPPAQFDARFDRLLVDGAARKIDLRYTFDGVWLAERDGQDKTFTRRQLVEADEEGSPMRLGSSPFALPLDAKKADILARFDVALADPSDDDPEDTFHLVLTPREGVRIDQTRIDLWYDDNTLLPRRVATVDESQNTSVIVLMKVQVNKALSDNVFDTTPPRGRGWDVQVEPLGEDDE